MWGCGASFCTGCGRTPRPGSGPTPPEADRPAAGSAAYESTGVRSGVRAPGDQERPHRFGSRISSYLGGRRGRLLSRGGRPPDPAGAGQVRETGCAPPPGIGGLETRAPTAQVVVQVMLVGGLFVPPTEAMKPNVVEPPAGSAPL
ncbi:hypothetical protein GCM10027605_33190 [Micromonospora zhanjiangensis]